MSVTTFHEDGGSLILQYAPTNGSDYVTSKLKSDGKAKIRKVFHVTTALRKDEPDSEDELEETEGFDIEFEHLSFEIGQTLGQYFLLSRDVLGINYDLFIDRGIRLETRHFVAVRDISIFGRLDEFNLRSIHIGGDHEDAIPEDVFNQFIADFPNTTEVDKYARTRIDSILSEYLNSPKDFQADFEQYRNKKRTWKGSLPRKALAPYEGDKFSGLYKKLKEMLEGITNYSEHQWQEEILEIVLLLFPRYIKAFRESPVKDSWAGTTRNVDFLLLDATGYIDVIEIKKPSFGQVVTVRTGRGNYVPKRELSEAVMQVEKHLYHFNRWGEKGEKELSKKYQQYLPNELKVKIVNPNGMIIMGREKDLTPDQRNDFEIIRRKYRNVLDIITYDDLLLRLKVIRNQFKKHQTI